MVDYIEEAEYEIGMAMAAIVASQYLEDPTSKSFTIHLAALHDIINKIPDQFKGIARLNYLLGSNDLLKTANTVTGIGGAGSAACSAACFLTAKNPAARWFYAAGGACSALGTCLSTYASVSSNATSCTYSFSGLFAIGSGASITFIGKRFVDVADIVEGKPKKPKWWKRRLSYYTNSGDIAFALPPSIEKIPYGKIVTGVTVVLTVYGYAKFILASYRRGQGLVYNLKLRRRSELIKKQAKYLVNYFSFVLVPSDKCSRVYCLAISN